MARGLARSGDFGEVVLVVVKGRIKFIKITCSESLSECVLCRSRQVAMVQSIGYPEYRPLVDEFVALAREALAGNIVSIVLYGSVARGDADRKSDIDLLLVLEEAAPAYCERLQLVLPVLRRLHERPCWQESVARGLFPELNVLILSRAEAQQNRHIFLDMIEDAHVLVDRGGFFRDRLGLLQKRLQELDAKKVRHNGTWYWDLKPDLKPGESVAL